MSDRVRAKLAGAQSSSRDPSRHRSRAAAAAAAARASGHLCEGDGRQLPDGSWVAVVVLRPDQIYLKDRVAERGVEVRLPDSEVAS